MSVKSLAYGVEPVRRWVGAAGVWRSAETGIDWSYGFVVVFQYESVERERWWCIFASACASPSNPAVVPLTLLFSSSSTMRARRVIDSLSSVTSATSAGISSLRTMLSRFPPGPAGVVVVHPKLKLHSGSVATLRSER
jgi:hypothetical protein